MEDELRDGSSFVDFLLPRPVRVVALGAAAAGCAVGTAVDIAAALAPGGADAPTLDALPINAAGALAFGAAAAWDAAGAERRRGERALVREAQLRSGDRVRVQLGDGRATTKLLPVDAKWVSKRLESWGRSEGLPMLSPEKAAVLRGIVADAAPRAVVHVGSLLGYSTIQMCGALPDGGAGCRLVTLERDPLMFACAKRFVHQARLDGLASRLHEVPHAADVVLGNAVDRAAVAGAAERAMAGAGTDGVDMLYLSGTPSEYGAYLAAASPFLRSGSVVVADHALVAERFMGACARELRRWHPTLLRRAVPRVRACA